MTKKDKKRQNSCPYIQDKDIEIGIVGTYNISNKNKRRKGMKELLLKIGELIENEIDNVEKIEYVDERMGHMFYIFMKDGKKILLSLIDSKL